MTVSTVWPPPIGARVRRPGSDASYEVIGRYENANLGAYVVLRFAIAGGWKVWPVTEGAWVRDGYVVVVHAGPQ